MKHVTNSPNLQREVDNIELNAALRLIKRHIGQADTEQNRNLHQAVQLIVTVARRHGLLFEHGGR